MFLAIFFPKRPGTLQIPQQWVLNILKWSNEGRMTINNGPRMKLEFDRSSSVEVVDHLLLERQIML